MRSEGRRNSSRVLLSKENDKSRKTRKKKKKQTLEKCLANVISLTFVF